MAKVRMSNRRADKPAIITYVSIDNLANVVDVSFEYTESDKPLHIMLSPHDIKRLMPCFEQCLHNHAITLAAVKAAYKKGNTK